MASMVASADGKVYKCKDTQGALIYQESPCKQDVQAVTSWTAATKPGQSDNQSGEIKNGVLVIKQSDNNHYFLNGTINGKLLTFVVDTGASTVALPREVAMSARIYCRDKILMQTANGSASACTAIIPQLKMGPFLIHNVPATISPNLGQPLLGMSVLQLFRIEQDNGEMRISGK
ncbi:MAG: TIGR02281 family clan AA aspartic protease [Gallionella sp.]